MAEGHVIARAPERRFERRARPWSGAARLALAALAALIAASPAFAGPIELTNAIFVERLAPTEKGGTRIHLRAPDTVASGDRLVFVLSYRNTGGALREGLTITNPLPKAVALAGDAGPLAQLSVDGGRSWGPLSDLTVATANGGRRAAHAEDVTHIRWSVPRTVPPGGEGKFVFRGRVR
jgi:hypothetical protein